MVIAGVAKEAHVSVLIRSWVVIQVGRHTIVLVTWWTLLVLLLSWHLFTGPKSLQINLTLLMLETECSDLFDQYHACWWNQEGTWEWWEHLSIRPGISNHYLEKWSLTSLQTWSYICFHLYLLQRMIMSCGMFSNRGWSCHVECSRIILSTILNTLTWAFFYTWLIMLN